MIGLAPAGDADQVHQTFGNPLAPMGTPGHTHLLAATTSTTLPSHGIAGDSGCFILCEKPGAAGVVGLGQGSAQSSWTGLPYLATRACRPCGNGGQPKCGD